MRSWNSSPQFALVAAFLMALASAVASAAPPVVPDNGKGTIDLPVPAPYVSPANVHARIAQGETGFELKVEHSRFFNIQVHPGGILNGNVETFGSALTLTVQGTGDLKDWSRTLVVPAKTETHTGPRKEGDAVQSFDTNMYRIEGGIGSGAKDPDFESFEVIAGTANGYDSPGHTTLYRQKDGSFLVDSNFQIKYAIKFKGTEGGALKGLEGGTEGSTTMNAVGPDGCADDGAGK